MERYQKMWRYMESNTPHTFVYSYEEGVQVFILVFEKVGPCSN